ncbi:hypothetical protein LAZ67_4002199 [Cordylochernes scorpioides]|uniref:Uncharacterized protein n=1 Tax=Cordylochernes scorpioides TaxID=51811 RepID=A0ABY6KHB4_9ARAC|nr:hypothetical protein LAZ67_4002199 [Cordylochernes scorpioides]
MSPRAGQNLCAGRMWPSGRSLETPGLDHPSTDPPPWHHLHDMNNTIVDSIVDGRISMEDDTRCERPKTVTVCENVEKLKACLLLNRRIAIREVSEET